MLDFKPLTLGDIEAVRPHFMDTHSRLCDYTVGGTVMWRDFFKTEFCVDAGALYFKTIYLSGETAFTYPLGCEPKTAIQKVIDYCAAAGIPTAFCTISKRQLEFLQSNFKVKSATPERDWFDYLYNAADLINLSGKRYHGQKNFVNRFKRLYPDYEFREIGPDNIELARAFLQRYFPIESAGGDPIEKEELVKVFEVFDNFELYGMPGGIVTVGGDVAALAVGEVVNDTLFVHIEKANREYQGSYQLIVNEFAKHFAGAGIEYVNREEDVGDEGLRRSKLDYHPAEILEKFTVILETE